MGFETIIVIIITVGAIILFVSEKIPPDTTALLVTVLLMIFGIVTPQEGLSGFSNIGTMSVFALLVLSIGLQSTGAVSYLADYVENLSSKSEAKTITLLSFLVGLPSAFLNNTAIVAIMLPVVSRLSKITGISESKLMIPLSFAAMAGGTMTIIGTSTNVIVSSIYQEHSGIEFGVFEFSVMGIILFFTYLLYMLIIGRYILPNHKTNKQLTDEYELGKFILNVTIEKGSPLIGKSIENSQLDNYRIRTLNLNRKGQEATWIPAWNEHLMEGDELIVKANYQTLIEVKRKLGLKIKKTSDLDDKKLTSEEAVLFEAIIGNNSFLIGKKIIDVDFKQAFGAIPLAIKREGEMINQEITDIRLKFGDTLLLEARRNDIDRFYNSKDFIVLEKKKKPNYRTDKIFISIAIVVLVIIAIATKLTNLATATLAGCVAMYLTKCVSPKYVYRKMEWRIIFLLAGVIPLGIAVQKTGLAAILAENLLTIIGQSSHYLIIGVLYLITVFFTSIMSNNATAVLLAPIAIGMANQLGIDPKMFLVTVMFAASTSFITPIGYQTNTLVYGPGNYKFIDYFKVGGLLVVLFTVISIFVIPYLYG